MKRVLCILCILVLALSVCGCGSPASRPINNPTETLKVGETATMGELEFTVTSWKFSSNLADKSSQGKASDGNVYCVVTLKVKNNGKTMTTLATSITNPKYNTKLTFADGYEYLCTFSDNELFFNSKQTIKALEEYSGTMNYEVPKEVKNSEDKPLLFTFQWKGDNSKVVEWVLR